MITSPSAAASDSLVSMRIGYSAQMKFWEPCSSFLDTPFDFIFCRNTLMYFDPAARQRAIARFEAALAPGGYLFVSHAENLSGIQHGLERLAPAIYRQGLR